MGSFLISSVYAEEDHHDEHGDEKESEHAGHEEGHEETSTKFGPGKAIIAVRNEGQSFQLSEESSRFLGLVFSRPTEIKNPQENKPQRIFEIPLKALVSFQAEHGLFIREKAWIELIDVKVVKRFPDKIWVSGKELNSETEMAVQGTGFLRAAHLDASGQGGEGHAH